MEVREIEQKVEQYFAENGLDDCFFVDAVVKGKKAEVFIDRDGGISFDICKKVSRFLEADLDASGRMGDDYILEVSSPGVGNPLVKPRQYVNNIGREIELTVGDTKLKGKLVAADAEKIGVQYEEIVREGKKKIKNQIITEVIYADVKSAKIKISFK